ncbi:MAG TPA: hypothetical protein VJV78_23150 [Polyangiales bacterium]|nr:hypothetical protein [Polyangiales bacterium]
MATPHRSLWRVFALSLVFAALGGCAARASYVYDEPVVYERPVYVAPPPPVYHYHSPPPAVVHHYYVTPRGYHAPVYRAPARPYRAPAAHPHHHGSSRHHDDDRRDHHHHH